MVVRRRKRMRWRIRVAVIGGIVLGRRRWGRRRRGRGRRRRVAI